MLSVGKVTAGSAAYYEASVARGEEDYYQRGGEAPGVWIGSGLDAVEGADVGGIVSSAEHSDLFVEQRVHDQQLGVKTSSRFVAKTQFDVAAGQTVPVLDADGEIVRIEQQPVTGLDLTFSAPKSVSVAWAVGDQDLGERLWEAHTAAVEAAFSYLEDHACYTRSGKGGAEVVDGQGFVAARYDHRTSRNLDPQIHSHVLVANRVQRGDGEWRAIDARQIYRQAKTAGMVYQAGLRAEIEASTDLRFAGVDANGQAELVNVDPLVMEAFSTRSSEIDAALQVWRADWATKHDGVVPPAEAERAMGMQLALGTRATKTVEEFSTVELQERWRGQVIEQGHDPDLVINDHSPTEAVLPSRGIAVLGSEVESVAAVFSRDDVARTVARYATGTNAQEVAANIEATVDGVLEGCVTVEPIQGIEVRSSDLRPVTEQPSTAIHTTQGTLDLEQRVLRWCEQDGAPTIQADPTRFEDLDASQAAAVVQVLGDGNQVSVIVGPAGHGKTTTVAEIADTWRAEHGQVVGLAPSAQASQLLSQAGIESETIDAWLYNPQLSTGDLVIVDEAGMVGTRHLDQLRHQAQQAGAKVVLVGDPEQLAAVRKAGGILADLVDAAALPHHNLSIADLQVAHRFENRTVAQVAQQLRERNPDVSETLADAGWLHGHQDPLGGRTAVLEAAWADASQGVETVILVSTRADMAELNQAWQTRRIQTGELDPDTRNSRSGYMDGEQIVAKRNQRNITWITAGGETEWLRNGTALSVEQHTADNGAICRTPDGERIAIDGDYLKTHTQLGYARTIHAAQGASVDTAHVLIGPSTESHGLYVAGSRARHATHIHAVQPRETTNDHASGSSQVRQEWSPQQAVRATMERVDPASRTAHRTLREHRAGQVQALVDRHVGKTPPPYPKPGEQERLGNLIQRTSQHDSPAAAAQLRSLANRLNTWARQYDTAIGFDQQPGGAEYRQQWTEQQQQRSPKIEQEHDLDHGY